MKKILVMLALGLGITFAANAQKKSKKGNDFTPDQKTQLAVKKMVLELDLTDSQVKQIRPLIQEKIVKREAMNQKRKALKDSKTEISSDEKFEKANRMLDEKIAFKNKMKQILTPEQMDKFEKMKRKKGDKGKKGKKKGLKEGKTCENKSCDGEKAKACEGKK